MALLTEIRKKTSENIVKPIKQISRQQRHFPILDPWRSTSRFACCTLFVQRRYSGNQIYGMWIGPDSCCYPHIDNNVSFLNRRRKCYGFIIFTGTIFYVFSHASPCLFICSFEIIFFNSNVFISLKIFRCFSKKWSMIYYLKYLYISNLLRDSKCTFKTYQKFETWAGSESKRLESVLN